MSEVNSVENGVEAVKVVSFSDLGGLGYQLALDTYQRPYVWSKQKIEQMLEDLKAFKQKSKGDSPKDYYFGSILLHRHHDEKKLFVIDGQQRLTSLAVLYAQLHQTLPEWLRFDFRSPISVKNIQQAQKVMQTSASNLAIELTQDLFARLLFTVIVVDREDLAFTFFDTQNNRGVPLGATDLLKAYHLRAINSGQKVQDEALQSHCARRWEAVQVSGEKDKRSKANDFAPELFHYYLWRARNWRGNDVKELENRDELFDAFGKQSLSGCQSGRVKLYPGGSNQWASSLALLANNEYRLGLNDLHLSQSAANLPFALRHPINKGAGFFLYAEKYSALLNAVFHDDSSPDFEIQSMKRLFSKVVERLSIYLQRLFKLAVLTYVDRLGTDGLFEFSQWLNYRLGAIRLEKSDIRWQTPIVFLRDEKRNLMDVISFAYEPSEVIEFLQLKKVDKIYRKDKDDEGWQCVIASGEGVHGRYAKALADFYGVNNFLSLSSVISKSIEETASASI